VDFFADGMTSAMREIFSKASFSDHATRDIIDIGAPDRFARAHILSHELDRGVTRVAHDVEYLGVFFRYRFADITGPGLIGKDRAGLAQFRSEIEQDEIAALDG